MSLRYGNKAAPNYIKSTVASSNNGRFSSPKVTLTNPNVWTRPADWLPITEPVSPEQKVVLLVAVYNNDSNFLALNFTGAYTVDWGDGVVENFNSSTQSNHKYDWSSISSGTVTSEGFRQVIVTITPQAGQNLTNIDLRRYHPDLSPLGLYPTNPIFEAYISAPEATFMTIGASGDASQGEARLRSLMYLKIINAAKMLNWSYLASYLLNLKKFEAYNVAPTTLNFAFYGSSSLIDVNLFNTSNCTNLNYTFAACTSLATVPLFDTSKVTFFTNTFNNCYSLTSVPAFNTSSVTYFTSTFQACYALRAIPAFSFPKVISVQNAFNSCYSLVSAPPFTTSSALTTLDGMFSNCYTLREVGGFVTTGVTTVTSMFSNCYSLKSVPNFVFNALTTVTSMFSGCYSLETAPLLTIPATATNFTSMFNNCYRLTTVNLFNTSGATTMNTMFQNCYSLQTIPLFDTGNVTSMTSMFANCYSLISVPLLNTIKVTGMSSMFQNCYTLPTVPLFNTVAALNMSFMFNGCQSLDSCPNFNTANVTNMSTMFQNCYSLKIAPAFNTAKVTDMSAMFNGAIQLRTVPQYDAFQVSNMSNIFFGCYNLTTVETMLRCGSVTTAPSVSSAFNLRRVAFSGLKRGVNISFLLLGKLGLEAFFDALANPTAGQTITITNSYGAAAGPVADGVYTLTGTSTAGSNIITMANTSNLQVGMQVVGTGSPLTTTRSVTMDGTAWVVNLTAHGLENGDEVAFTGTGGGLTANTIYYVVNKTTDNFQLADTLGGSAKALSAGSNAMRYRTAIASIDPNVSVTLTRPMASSSTSSFVFRQLRTGTALLKGYSVTG